MFTVIGVLDFDRKYLPKNKEIKYAMQKFLLFLALKFTICNSPTFVLLKPLKKIKGDN